MVILAVVCTFLVVAIAFTALVSYTLDKYNGKTALTFLDILDLVFVWVVIGGVYPHILNVIFDDDDQHGIVVLRKNNNFFQNLDIDMFQIIKLSLMESVLYQNMDEDIFWYKYDNNCLDFGIFSKYSEVNDSFVSGILYDKEFSLNDLDRVIHENGVNATWMGSPILLLIAQAGRFDLLKSILTQISLDVNVVDNYGNTLLHYLSANKNMVSSDILSDIKKHGFNLYSWKNINGELAI